MKKELHPIGWYAKRVAPHLPPEAFKPQPQRLWGGLFFLALYVACIAAIGLFDLPWYANLGLAFLVGTGFTGTSFLAHEILHGTVVKSAWLRDLLGCIAFAPFNLGAKLWRKWHNMEHHAHTQSDGDDPDAMATLEEFYRSPFLKAIYRLAPGARGTLNFILFTVSFTVHSTNMFRRYIGEFKPEERRVVWLQLLVPWTLWLSLLVWMGPYKFLFAYVLPILYANFLLISYIATNHQLNPLTDVNDPLANSLSVTVPTWVNVIHFNFSYHTEHHLFPGMSPKWGPLVQAELRRQFPDQYFEMPMTRAMAMLWRTPRVYHNDVELVDPVRGQGHGTLGNNLSARPRQVDIPAPAEARLHTSLQQGD